MATSPIPGKLLTIIPYDNPGVTTQIRLDKLKIFEGKKLPAEVMSNIETETSTYTFYTDTLTRTVRFKSLVTNEG